MTCSAYLQKSGVLGTVFGLLQDASKVICNIFKRSPVFRVGGDEFAAIVQGNDYANLEELIGRVNDHNAQAVRSDGIVIPCGMSNDDGEPSVTAVFEQADLNVYDN